MRIFAEMKTKFTFNKYCLLIIKEKLSDSQNNFPDSMPAY